MDQNDSSVRITHAAPPVDAFIAQRAALGWGTLTHDDAQRALAASLAHVTCWQGPTLAGFGRLVGDGVVYFYLQDIVVVPAFQGAGLGKRIVHTLLQEVRAHGSDEGAVGLMAVAGIEPFYAEFGFVTRPGVGVGAGMTCAVSELRL